MTSFINSNFLLETKKAQELYHQYAEKLPVIDYHCHISAKDIYEDRPFKDLTELWLTDDHYKWRIIRACGIDERYVTGNACNYEKFLAFARSLPYAIGNPVFHWAHLELRRYFGIEQILTEKTAPFIWEKTNEILSDGMHTPGYFIKKSNVYVICTTEDPADDLKYHFLIAKEKKLDAKVLPAFRLDNSLFIQKSDWRSYIKRLSAVSGVEIDGFENLKEALFIRMNEFDKAGCIASDHGFEAMPFHMCSSEEADIIMKKALSGETITDAEGERYQTALMLWAGREYYRRGWAMELHVNINRNCNTSAVEKIGAARGFDSVADYPMSLKMNGYLNALEMTGELPRTILFSLNETDNPVFASMLGNFQDSSVPSKIQLGTAWWFQDNIDGMTKQLCSLANEGVLGHFIGMLTDSRSFLSYTRHEYFRRVLCNQIGQWVEKGQYPDDNELLEQLVYGICFGNAKKYFNL